MPQQVFIQWGPFPNGSTTGTAATSTYTDAYVIQDGRGLEFIVQNMSTVTAIVYKTDIQISQSTYAVRYPYTTEKSLGIAPTSTGVCVFEQAGATVAYYKAIVSVASNTTTPALFTIDQIKY